MCLEKHKCLKHLRPIVSTVSDKEDIVRLFPKLKNTQRNECINRVAKECL